MRTEYFAKWFKAKNQGLQPLTVEEASLRHQRQEPYVALLSNNNRFLLLVDIAGQWVSVRFFDEHERIYLDYDFRMSNETDLFLKGALYRNFRDGEQKVASSCHFSFEPDGSYVVAVQNEGQDCELSGKSDASALFANYPSFGRYDELCTLERIPKNLV